MAYSFVLFLHSFLRWFVLVLFVATLVRSALGMARGSGWTMADERIQRALVISVDTQLVLGLWLYLVASPLTQSFFANPRAGMRDVLVRFFAIEHVTSMMVALIVLHVGRVLSRRATNQRQRHRRAFGWSLAALICVLIGIPWPFLRYGRPLLRLP